jgi:Putative auto-transporter adhesin, head GIN domain
MREAHMAKTLGLIAVGGLSVGFASLALAYALVGHDVANFLDRDTFLAHSCGDNSGKGDAKQRERRLAWEGDDAVEISLPASVRYRGGEGSDVIVRGSPDVIAHVEVHRGRITLDCHRFGGFRDIEVTLPGRTFRRIGLSGSGKLVMENVNQPDLDFRISGSGSVRAQGTVDHATINVAGSGDARLADLAMKELTAKISGSGKVEAAPKDAADIHISGSGDVRLLSHPARLSSHVAGSGRITQASVDSAEGKDRR